MDLKFEERQKFTQWWLWVLLLGITLVPVYGIYKQTILGEQFGDNPSSNFGLILLLISMLTFVGFFWSIELKTNIDNEAIRVKFFPFTKIEIRWDEIVRAKVVNYGFVGGWGVRLGSKYGTVYNTSGEIGLAVELKNGKKLCIGTQKEEELSKLIKEAGRRQKLLHS